MYCTSHTPAQQLINICVKQIKHKFLPDPSTVYPVEFFWIHHFQSNKDKDKKNMRATGSSQVLLVEHTCYYDKTSTHK